MEKNQKCKICAMIFHYSSSLDTHMFLSHFYESPYLYLTESEKKERGII